MKRNEPSAEVVATGCGDAPGEAIATATPGSPEFESKSTTVPVTVAGVLDGGELCAGVGGVPETPPLAHAARLIASIAAKARVSFIKPFRLLKLRKSRLSS